MRILAAYYSRTGYTRRLMELVGGELTRLGHTVEYEPIRPVRKDSCFREILKDIPHYPAILASLFRSCWRARYIRSYTQTEEAIEPLLLPDVSDFDRVCVGGPKWAQLSYPVARYLRRVSGIEGKRVGSVSTFGGPPLRIFELELIECSSERLIRERGASIAAHLSVSSGYHEAHRMPLFRFLSRARFGKPIEYFKIGSPYADGMIRRFCAALTGC